MDPSTLLILLLSCAPLVDPGTAQALVAVESSLNPHAIGVVGGTLERQPRNQREALVTAQALVLMPVPRYPTHFRALRNRRIHGESSPSVSGDQDICTVRKTRSGCGIMIVKRPSAVVTPVMPAGEPFGLYG